MTRGSAALALLALLSFGCGPAPRKGAVPPLPEDPAASITSPLADAGWVGSAACLGCHVEAHGQWAGSSHASTVRPASIEDEDLLANIIQCSDMEATHVLGDRHEVRFLVERPDVAPGLGRWLALPCSWRPAEKAPEVNHLDNWRDRPWESACAACHVTGFRPDHSFLEVGVGCESCHGPGGRHVVAPTESWTVTLKDSARDEVTACASCHLQDGVSRRSGRKFPDGYIPGGSLFDDFVFDWALLDQAGVEKALDVHQKILVKRIAFQGDASLRCTSCHAMHGLGHEKHRELPQQPYCSTCHEQDLKKLKEYSQQCNACEF